jgi:hypothetical protein
MISSTQYIYHTKKTKKFYTFLSSSPSTSRGPSSPQCNGYQGCPRKEAGEALHRPFTFIEVNKDKAIPVTGRGGP